MVRAPHPAASADINKIIRAAYGSQTIYQDPSPDAIKAWNSWTEELARGGSAVPPGMTSQDAMWINNGDLSYTDANILPPFETATIENMNKAGYRNTQLVNNNKEHLRLAEARGLASNMQPFSKKLLCALETTGGITLADKACLFALQKAKNLGVRCVLDSVVGKVIATVQGCAGTLIHSTTTSSSTTSLTTMAWWLPRPEADMRPSPPLLSEAEWWTLLKARAQTDQS